jgi:indolepyruvate ferredoxin oxidoreductase
MAAGHLQLRPVSPPVNCVSPDISPANIFGKSQERQAERALVPEYQDCIADLLKSLTAGSRALTLGIARVPEDTRGDGHVKRRHIHAVRPRWDKLMQRWRGGELQRAA